ncbi:hypothetical protein [Bacillus sp. LL01]|nr:hypothetical protein [Bacillus sp. LL01]
MTSLTLRIFVEVWYLPELTVKAITFRSNYLELLIGAKGEDS